MALGIRRHQWWNLPRPQSTQHAVKPGLGLPPSRRSSSGSDGAGAPPGAGSSAHRAQGPMLPSAALPQVVQYLHGHLLYHMHHSPQPEEGERLLTRCLPWLEAILITRGTHALLRDLRWWMQVSLGRSA